MRNIGVWIVALAALFLCSCRSGEPIEESTCSLAGHWRAHEERVGGDCLPDRATASSVVFDMSELDMTEEGSLWKLDLSRGGTSLESCSGVPSDDRCRLEMTCSATLDGGRIDYAFSLEFAGTGALSGSNVLTFITDDGEECQAHFTLAGERVSPEELEGTLEGGATP